MAEGGGQAHVTLTGWRDSSATYPFQGAGGELYRVLGLPYAELSWGSGLSSRNGFAIEAVPFEGKAVTSKEPGRHLMLTFDIALRATETLEFISAAGECVVTVETASAHRVAGSFHCSNVPGGLYRKINAEGTFSATG